MMDRNNRPWFPSAAFLWPALAVAAAGDVASAFARELASFAAAPMDEAKKPEPSWTTPNAISLELGSVRLRDFSTVPQGVATLICAPFALHGATVADFAPGYSLVQALREAGLTRTFVTDWRSATAEMRYFSIDTYLADLNVLVDHLGDAVDLIGLCQGGWLALMYAARFPAKVRRLVLVGAPIDTAAGESMLSRIAHDTPSMVFRELVDLGDGRVLGQRILGFWGPRTPDAAGIRDMLQVPEAPGSDTFAELKARFRIWYGETVDLPGTYYLQVIERLFKANELATGRFVALGRRIDLSTLHSPVYLLAARDDELVAPAQILATEHLVGTTKGDVIPMVAPCHHLGLFMGRKTLTETWPQIAHWLMQPRSLTSGAGNRRVTERRTA